MVLLHAQGRVSEVGTKSHCWLTSGKIHQITYGVCSKPYISSVPQTAMPPEHAPRILLVDDHELVRKGLASLLSTRWLVCGEAGNGEEAIEKILELRPDLVLLDLSMPVMGGTATARYIRRIVPGIKLVLLSIHDSATVAELAKAVGADAFLSKSCTVAALHSVISALIGPATGDDPPLSFRVASAD